MVFLMVQVIQTSRVIIVITDVFINTFILILSLQEKAYASPSLSLHLIFKFIVKHVFKSNSKIDITLKDRKHNTVTVRGNSGTKHVNLDIEITSDTQKDPFTMCLSAPNQHKKCTHEHLNNLQRMVLFLQNIKWVDMNVLHH